jgi:hypothetical protein
MEVDMDLSIRGTEVFSSPMAYLADNEATERLPDNEAAETAVSTQNKAPLRASEGSLLDVQA